MPGTGFLNDTSSDMKSVQYSSKVGSSGMSSSTRDMAWYPNSGVTHHVSKDASALNDSARYTSITPILMGDETPALISCVGNTELFAKDKVFYLLNVLHVPNIRKNLLSVSQFALENTWFLNFIRLIVS